MSVELLCDEILSDDEEINDEKNTVCENEKISGKKRPCDGTTSTDDDYQPIYQPRNQVEDERGFGFGLKEFTATVIINGMKLRIFFPNGEFTEDNIDVLQKKSFDVKSMTSVSVGDFEIRSRYGVQLGIILYAFVLSIFNGKFYYKNLPSYFLVKYNKIDQKCIDLVNNAFSLNRDGRNYLKDFINMYCVE